MDKFVVARSRKEVLTKDSCEEGDLTDQSFSSSSTAAVIDLTEEDEAQLVVVTDNNADDDLADNDEETKQSALSQNHEHARYLNDAYRRTLLESLSGVTEQPLESSIFHQEECNEVTRIMSLPREAQVVLARVLFLQGPWFRWTTAVKHLKKEGLAESIMATAIELLQSHGIIAEVEDEAEWHAVIGSSIISKAELMALLKKFEPRTKTTLNKDDLSGKIRAILENKSTIFGAPQIRIASHMRRITSSDPLFKIRPKVFRLCKTALCLSHFYVDFIDSMAMTIQQQQQKVDMFITTLKWRGATRIPTCLSPGYAIVMGLNDGGGTDSSTPAEVEQDDVSMILEPQESRPSLEKTEMSYFNHAMKALKTRDNINRVELAYEIYELLLVAVSCSSPEVSDPMMLSTSSDFETMVPNNSLIDMLLDDKRSSPITVPRLIHLALQCLNPESSVADDQHHLLAFCDANHVLAYALTEAVTWLENSKQFEAAVMLLYKLLQHTSLGLLRHDRRAFWWNRLVINLSSHLKRKSEALEQCELALQEPYFEQSDPRLFALRVRVLSAKLKEPIETSSGEAEEPGADFLLQAPVMHLQAKPFGPAGKGSGRKGKQQFLEPERDSSRMTCSVENFALHHYSEERNGGWRGIHTENHALHCIFNLLMRDILRAETEVLLGKLAVYRKRPLDLHSSFSLFYENRKDLVDARVAEMETWTCLDVAKRIGDAFHASSRSNRKTKNSLSLAMLQIIGICLGGKGVAIICDMFAKQYRHVGRGGAPDLLLVRLPCIDQKLLRSLFNHDEEPVQDSQGDEYFVQELDLENLPVIDSHEVGSIKFVEVKSENDRLSDKQVGWLNSLFARGIPCEVLKIGTTDSLTVGRSVQRPSKRSKQLKVASKSAEPIEVNDDDIFE